MLNLNTTDLRRCPKLVETINRLGIDLNGRMTFPLTLGDGSKIRVTEAEWRAMLNDDEVAGGVFGLDAVDGAGHLMICGTVADCVALRTLGFNAIAVLGDPEVLYQFVGRLPVVKTYVWTETDDFAKSVAQALKLTVYHINAQAPYDLLKAHSFDLDTTRDAINTLIKSAVPTPYEPRFLVTDAFNLCQAETENFLWLMNGLIPKGVVIGLFGEAGIGKSTFLINLAVCVALGRPFAGKLPTKKGIVLYINTENPIFALTDRLKALCDQSELANLSGYLYFVNGSGFAPDDDKRFRLFVTEIYTQLGGRTPDLVIIDTLNDFLPVDDCNDEAQARRQILVLRRLRKVFDCTVIAVGHTLKGQAPSNLRWRGSQARFDAVDIALDFQRNPKHPDLIKLVVAKDRLGMLTQNIILRRGRQFDFIALPDSPLPDSARRILDLLKQSHPNQLTLRDIISRTNLPKRTVCHNLRRLQEMGLIERVARNLYRLINP